MSSNTKLHHLCKLLLESRDRYAEHARAAKKYGGLESATQYAEWCARHDVCHWLLMHVEDAISGKPEQDAVSPGRAIDEIKAEILERKGKAERQVEYCARGSTPRDVMRMEFHRGYATAAEDVLEMLNAKFRSEDKENA